MSILSRLGGWRLDDGVSPTARAALPQTAGYTLGGGGDVAQVRHLPAEVAAAFGLSTGGGVVDRTAAMRIPAIRRGRQVIVGSLAACPLVAHRTNPDGTVETVDRPLLRQPDPNTTLQYVLTWTIDDLLFYGVAWWLIRERDGQGYPSAVERVSRDRLTVDLQRGRVFVDQADKTADVVRFDGPDEGVIEYQGDTLSTSQLLSAAVRKFARLDVPLGALKLKEGAAELQTAPFTCGIENDPRSQVDYLLDTWEEARRSRTTAYLNGAIDYSTYQLDAAAIQLVEGRAEQNAECARLLNLAPRYVNAPSASGMTYTNVEAERRDLADTSLVGFQTAIEQRLSMGDVTPRGTAVRFDLTRLLRGDTLTALQSADIAVRLNAMTGDEVRTDVLGRTPLPAGNRTPTPTPEATP